MPESPEHAAHVVASMIGCYAESLPRNWQRMSEPQPLPADSRRQADAMLAACDYQVWQTVVAWLDLRGEDMLFIEGAEDFDIVGGGEGQATQVKASADPISLGQKSIQKALNNFWRLKQAPTISV